MKKERLQENHQKVNTYKEMAIYKKVNLLLLYEIKNTFIIAHCQYIIDSRKIKFFKKRYCIFEKDMLIYNTFTASEIRSGPMVKRLRHRPFTAVTRVRFPLGSLVLGLIYGAVAKR